MKCKKCGCKNDKKAKKCRNCGAPLKKFGVLKCFFILLAFVIAVGGICIALVYNGKANIPVVNDLLEILKIHKDVEDVDNSQFNNLSGAFTEYKINDEVSAVVVGKTAAEQMGVSLGEDDLSVKNVSQDLEETYYRLQQSYKGIPVYGRTMVVVADEDGNAEGVTSNVVSIPESVSVTPTVSKDMIEKNVKKYLKKNYGSDDSVSLSELSEENLVIYNLDMDQDALAYKIVVASKYGCFEVLADAGSGQILLWNEGISDVQSQMEYDGQQKKQYFTAEKEEQQYSMEYVTSTGTTISVYEPKRGHDYDWYMSDANANLIAWKEGEQPDKSAVDALTNMSSVFEYYYKEFGRNSFDGLGVDIPVYIHTIGYLDGDNGKNEKVVNNAYYINFFDDQPLISYTKRYDSQGNELDEYSENVIVAAHEFTHGIIDYTSGLSNTKKNLMPGGINEGIADIMGYCAESTITNTGMDWNIPDIRDSRNPSGMQIFNYKDYASSDKEVHKTSTIVSHAAYLMNTGNEGTTENISKDILEKLWYKTALILPQNCTFSVLREYVIMTAKRMELSEKKIDCIKTAFDAVGVSGMEQDGYTCKKNPKITVLDYNGDIYTDYTVEIDGNKEYLWGLIKIKYQNTIDMSQAQSSEITLGTGTYSVKVVDNKDKDKSSICQVKVSSRGDTSELKFITDFGNNKGTDTGNNSSTNTGKNDQAADERNIVLVLDNSGSMDGEPLAQTKTAANKFIETVLQEDAASALVTYSGSAEKRSGFSKKESDLKPKIQEISVDGETNMEAGLEMASDLLKNSSAKKKIIVLMSDGEPTTGKSGDELIEYAEQLKQRGIYIYTLGFFENVSDASSAQALMEGIASEGCHYEVSDANSLKFFFGDIADQINGQKYIYIRIACPVDVSVTSNGETLDSADEEKVRTSYGSLTFEQNADQTGMDDEDTTKILRLKDGEKYDIKINGTGTGTMDYTIGFMDESGEYSDFRTFENINITRTTVVDTVADSESATVLKVDEDSDGKYDLKYRADVNQKGQLVDYGYVVYLLLIGGGCLGFLIVSIRIWRKVAKRKLRKAEGTCCCPRCGYPNGYSAQFCGSCGAPLSKKKWRD